MKKETREKISVSMTKLRSKNRKDKLKSSQGYWLKYVGNDKNYQGELYRLEHRYIFEKELNRKLYSNEQVHHLNGDKLDNSRENLILTSNGIHQHKHHKLFKGKESKQCLYCFKILPLSKFNKNGQKFKYIGDNYRSICKECFKNRDC